MAAVFGPEARSRVTIAHLLTMCIVAIIVAMVLPGSEKARDDVDTLGRFVTGAQPDAAKLDAGIRAEELDLDRLAASLAELRARLAETERRHPDGMSAPQHRAYMRLVEEHNAVRYSQAPAVQVPEQQSPPEPQPVPVSPQHVAKKAPGWQA